MSNTDPINFPITQYSEVPCYNETSIESQTRPITDFHLNVSWHRLLKPFIEGNPVFFVNGQFANKGYLLKMMYVPSTKVLHIANDENYQDLAKLVGQTFNRRIKHLAEYIKDICKWIHKSALGSSPENLLRIILLRPDTTEFSFSWNDETPICCNLERCYNGISTELAGE
jgi:hypothetical protein